MGGIVEGLAGVFFGFVSMCLFNILPIRICFFCFFYDVVVSIDYGVGRMKLKANFVWFLISAFAMSLVCNYTVKLCLFYWQTINSTTYRRTRSKMVRRSVTRGNDSGGY